MYQKKVRLNKFFFFLNNTVNTTIFQVTKEMFEAFMVAGFKLISTLCTRCL